MGNYDFSSPPRLKKREEENEEKEISLLPNRVAEDIACCTSVPSLGKKVCETRGKFPFFSYLFGSNEYMCVSRNM